MKLTALLCLALLACSPSDAQDDPYAKIPADATGDTLKAQLHDLIDDHESLDYGDLWDALACCNWLSAALMLLHAQVIECRIPG